MSKSRKQKTFIDYELPAKDLEEVRGGRRDGQYTTMAVGEEGGESGKVTTMAVGEEGGVTTLALGEETGSIS